MPRLGRDQLSERLVVDGIAELGEILDAHAATALRDQALRARSFGPEMFLSEAEYRRNPEHFGVNPRPGRNLLERLESEARFVTEDPYLGQVLQWVLGKEYRLHNRKLVCGVPDAWIPDWLRLEMSRASIHNLGAYVRPELRDVTYFHGIDYHQDLVDWPSWPPEKRWHDIVTLYVYLHPVGAADAPLHVLPGSHTLGASTFPHRLERAGGARFEYTHDDGRRRMLPELCLLGGAGYVALWNGYLLHGTRSVEAENMRLSLRYVLGRSQRDEPAMLDGVLAAVDGPRWLCEARVDLDARGVAIGKHDAISGRRR